MRWLDREPPRASLDRSTWPPGAGRRAGARAALADGVIGRAPATLGETVDGADLVVLAAPPLECLDLLDELGGALAGALAAGATITDVASTKAVVIERADRLGLRFVGGHPMAGRDATGYAAAEADLFVDRPWVVCPGANAAPSDVDRVERLARATGAHPIRLDPAAHDRAVAAISHAPLDRVGGARRGGDRPARLAARPVAGRRRLARHDPARGRRARHGRRDRGDERARDRRRRPGDLGRPRRVGGPARRDRP